ncbi:hypothetical protein AVEN_259296-1 [Araneus ventricosus]|uniref:Reverse transcriptase domain-containing protein n=1 Tax=Araneus ventricosus TaxID=182803 RepID=A0A4Y2GKI5_ARAVE|nr:hypothetical protein AVEN_259296-1 [Araneus ventricosus]
MTISYSIGCPQGSNSRPLYSPLMADEALKINFENDVRFLAYSDYFYLFTAVTANQKFQARVKKSLLDLWSKRAQVSFAHERTRLIPFGKNGRYKHPPTALLQATGAEL